MVVGMMCSAGAFLLAAILQSKIDSLNEDPLAENNSGYTIINTVHCKIWCRGDPTPFFEGNIGPFGQTEFQRVASGVKTVQVMCPTMGTQGWTQATLSERKASRLVITSVSGVMSILVLDDKRDKSTNGTGYVSFLHLLAWVDEATIKVTSVRDDSTPMVLKVGLSKATEFHVLEPGSYQIAFPAMNNPMEAKSTKAGEWQDVGKPFEIGSGGVYTIAMIDPTNNIDLHEVVVEKYVTVKENSLSMMLMIPQYIAITVGEILFSISGLAFAYTQAPESMKSVIQACWLLTTSVGDLIVVLVAELDLLPSQMAEFYLFSAVMMADCVIFAIMTCFYSYVESETTMTTKKPGGSKKGDKKGGKKGDKKGGKKGDKKGGKKGGKKGDKKDSKKKKGGKEGDGKEGGGEDKKKGGPEKK
ncbi:hypothetical protein V1264_012559 [Littorina saxatilis]|uniref:Uncharacterized protein n=2 Tax=Littorina saxatilis TaxID=31220 RepID=A0AAN9BWQ3_9CAEN